jgi:predicted HicB family RNase H-like nuclease
MSYKGQIARIEFSEADGLFLGRLLGINDVVGFHADNVPGLHAAFEEAVDDYLETCIKVGKPPQKPASGKMMLRVPPEVHRAALVAAQAAGTSLNQWAAQVLQQSART